MASAAAPPATATSAVWDFSSSGHLGGTASHLQGARGFPSSSGRVGSLPKGRPVGVTQAPRSRGWRPRAGSLTPPAQKTPRGSGAERICEGCRGREGSRPASTRETAAGVDAAVRLPGLERPLPRLVPGPLRGLGTRQGQSLGSRRWHAAGRGVLVSPRPACGMFLHSSAFIRFLVALKSPYPLSTSRQGAETDWRSACK